MANPLLKITTGSFIRAIIVILLLLPVWMYFLWLGTDKRKFVVAIIDKTVLTDKGQEHISFNWVLNQERFSKTNSALYDHKKDYFGFFPLTKEKFQLKGLERFNTSQLDQLSDDADAIYITDAYGIYKNEWYLEGDDKEISGKVYGGMSRQDLYLIQKMKDRHKLIITEFNCLASPTPPSIRSDFENAFGIEWTGWIGRYFDSFDTTKNKELPGWLVKNYKKQHAGNWPFLKSGIAFVNADDRIVILENETHLRKELPLLYATTEGQQHYGLPKKTSYSFWFDIIQPDTTFNHVLAAFLIDVNKNGKKILDNYNLPSVFPAITVHINSDYRFFYFSADFADNPVTLTSSHFKGTPYFSYLMYNNREPLERKAFFWKIYQPLVTTILNDFYKTIKPS